VGWRDGWRDGWLLGDDDGCPEGAKEMVYWLDDEENVPEAIVVLDDVDDVGDEVGYEKYVHTALLMRF
jgi:hypothetical protein